MGREYYSRPINSGYTVVDGVTTGTYPSSYPSLVATWMEYKVTQSAADLLANRSTISVKLYSQVLDGGATTNMAQWDSAENFGYAGYNDANKQLYSCSYNFNNKNLNQFANATLVVPHNADGTKTITLQAGFTTRSRSITGGSVSVSVTLPTIAQKTTISSITGLKFGYPTQVTLSRKATNLRELVTLSIGSQTLKTTSVSDANFTFTLARTYAPTTALPCSLTGTLTVETFNGATSLGSVSQSVTFTVDANDSNFAPTLTANPTLQPYNDVVSVLGTYDAFAGYSKLNMLAAKADVSTKYGASIVSRVVTFSNGSSASADQTNHISTIYNAAGEASATYTVTDSRGFKCTYTATYYVSNYSNPTLSCYVYRGDSNGNEDESGTYLWVRNPQVDYVSMEGRNSVTLEYIVVDVVTTYTQLTIGQNAILASSISPDNTYEIHFAMTDIMGEVDDWRTSPATTAIPFNIRADGKAIAFGKKANAGGYYDNTAEFGYEVLLSNRLDQRLLLGNETVINSMDSDGFRSENNSDTGNHSVQASAHDSGSELVVSDHVHGSGGQPDVWKQAELTATDLAFRDWIADTRHSIIRLTPHLAQVWSSEIPANADLNTATYFPVGQYYCGTAVTAATLTNCPTGGLAFEMIVESPIQAEYDEPSGYTRYRVRMITTYGGAQYIQSCYKTSGGTYSFGEWLRVVDSSTALDNAVAWMKTQSGRLSSLDIGHSYNDDSRGRIRYDLSTSAQSGGANAVFGEGYVLTFMWDTSSRWDTQVYIPDADGNAPAFRTYRPNSGWGNVWRFQSEQVSTVTTDGVTWTVVKHFDGYVEMYADITLNGTWRTWGSLYVLSLSGNKKSLPVTLTKKLADVTTYIAPESGVSSDSAFPVQYYMTTENTYACDIARPSAGANSKNYYCRKYIRGLI